MGINTKIRREKNIKVLTLPDERQRRFSTEAAGPMTALTDTTDSKAPRQSRLYQ